jgi:hypothetical protein
MEKDFHCMAYYVDACLAVSIPTADGRFFEECHDAKDC